MASRKLFLSLAGVGASMATAGVVVMAEADHKAHESRKKGCGECVLAEGVMGKVLQEGAGSEKAEPRKGSREWQQSHLPADQLARTHDNKERYSGVPNIPMDIGFSKKSETIQGKKESGVISQAASNPGVILGMALTTAALLGMFKKSFMGDKVGAQRMMQYRIMAQFFTITALVAGVTIFGTNYDDGKDHGPKK